MNDWERLHRQAERCKQSYPPGTRVFYKAQATGLKDGHLYKMAGNAVSVPVISAIGQRLYEINHEFGIVKE